MRLITRALRIVEAMTPAYTYKVLRSGLAKRYGKEFIVDAKRHTELVAILTDLDARESVVQPSRRKAHGLKPKRKR